MGDNLRVLTQSIVQKGQFLSITLGNTECGSVVIISIHVIEHFFPNRVMLWLYPWQLTINMSLTHLAHGHGVKIDVVCIIGDVKSIWKLMDTFKDGYTGMHVGATHFLGLRSLHKQGILDRGWERGTNPFLVMYYGLGWRPHVAPSFHC